MILDLENPSLSRDPAVEAAAFVRARANARERTLVGRAGDPFFHHSHAAAQHLARLRNLVGKRAAAALIAEKGREMRCVPNASAQSMRALSQRQRERASREVRKQRITETVRNRLSWRGWSKFPKLLRAKSC